MQPTTAAIATALLSSVTYWLYKKANECPKELRHLPGPPVLSNILSFILGMGWVERFDKYHRANMIGRPCTKELMVPHGWSVQITGLANFKFLTSNPDKFPRLRLADYAKGTMAEKFFGRNILFETGPEWKYLRKAVTPAFKHGWDMDSLEEVCKQLIDGWAEQVDKPIDVTEWFPRFAIDSLGRGVFTTDFGALRYPDSSMANLYHDIFVGLNDIFYNIFRFFDTPKNPYRRPVYEKIAKFDRLFHDIIMRRQAMRERGEEMPKDLLTALLEAQHQEEDVRSLTDKEIRDNLTIFFLAGHDTSSTALVGVMYALASNPEVQNKAREELHHALDTIEGRSIPADSIQKLPYLDAIIKETLRLYGPVAELNPRRAKDDVVLPSGDIVPAGCAVIGNIWALHRDPAVWGEDAEVYRPERFMPGGSHEKTQLNAFNIGPHTCVGMTFALVEMKLVVARILETYRWKLAVPGQKLAYARSYLLNPKPLHIICEPLA